jgi:hypothetical protein
MNGNGVGTLNLDGGTIEVGGGSIDVDNLNIASTTGSNVSYTISAIDSLGTTVTVGSETIGVSGAGTLTQDIGTHTVINNLVLGANSGSSGTYNLNNGNLTVDGSISAGNGAGTINMNGGTLKAGTLNLSSTLAQFNFIGGTLSADTVVGNLVNQGGTLAPGASPGTAYVTGDYTQLVGALLDIQIGGLFAGSEYDVLNVDGNADLSGTLNVDWYDFGGGLYTASLGDSFDILSADSIFGTFDALSLAALGNSLQWDVNYILDPTGTDYVQLSVVSTVPIPASVWLFGSGLLGLMGVARRNTA